MRLRSLITTLALASIASACKPREEQPPVSVVEGAGIVEVPLLGFGYDSYTTNTKTNHCLNQLPTASLQSNPASFDRSEFTSVYEDTNTDKILGIQGALNLSWGTIGGKAAARWYQDISASKLSATWLLSRIVHKKIVSLPPDFPYTIRSDLRINDWEMFREHCGDQLITKILYGARFHAAIKFTFASEAAKSAWDAAIRPQFHPDMLTTLALSIAARRLSDQERQQTQVSVTYWKQGGGAAPEIFQTSDSFISCGLSGDSNDPSSPLGKCTQVLENLLRYSQKFGDTVTDDQWLAYESTAYAWAESPFSEEKKRQDSFASRIVSSALALNAHVKRLYALESRLLPNMNVVAKEYTEQLRELRDDLNANRVALQNNMLQCRSRSAACSDPAQVLQPERHSELEKLKFTLSYVEGGVGGDYPYASTSYGPLCPSYMNGMTTSAQTNSDGTLNMYGVSYSCDNLNPDPGLIYGRMFTPPLSINCPPAQVITGIIGRSNATVLLELGILCRLRAPGSPEMSIPVVVGAASGGSVNVSRCPEGQAVGGLWGESFGLWGITRVRIVCRD